MQLVIAEKPSVARNIAKVLHATNVKDGYLEGKEYLVSWCIGHLIELASADQYRDDWKAWKYETLPMIPENWKYQIKESTKGQFQILKELLHRADVTEIICATDAGREGELIFRLVYNQAECKLPFKRLWISSMEDVAIKEGFENLRSGTEYDALYEAALCRERADWIVGINATRLFSTLYGQTLNVGRVMTPTLAMAVMREATISAFKTEPFYTVQIGLDGFTASSERYKKKSEAETVSKAIEFLRIWFLCAPGMCFTNLFGSIFQAMGKWVQSLVLSVIRQAGFLFPLLVIMNTFVGEIGLVCAQPIADTVTLFVGIAFYVVLMRKYKVQA